MRGREQSERATKSKQERAQANMRACVSVCESDRKSNSEDKCEKARASLSKKAGT